MQNLTGLSWETAKKRLMRLVEMRILEHKIREMYGKGRDSKAHFVLRTGNTNGKKS